jgi:uncharacterized membrane protein
MMTEGDEHARRNTGAGQENHGKAARILDERLARGEIDAEEYRRLRDLIGSGRSDSLSGAGGAR